MAALGSCVFIAATALHRKTRIDDACFARNRVGDFGAEKMQHEGAKARRQERLG